MASKFGITFEGLEELTKACEDCASEIELAAVNRKIVRRSTEVVKSNMEERIPVSGNPAKSGRAGCRPPGHARDNVPVGKVRTRGTSASAEVGWKLGDHDAWFYMKFVNWGTTKMPPREFVKTATAASEGEITQIAREEYEDFLKAKFGG